MGNLYEMIEVAKNCSGYTPGYNGMQSSTCDLGDKSCKNCTHFRDGVCTINYYDKVVKSLDQC